MHSADRRSFLLAGAITVTSGAAALAHELLWTRRLVDVLGASADSTARVFGCLFLGLALGGAAACYVTPRVRSPWRAIGLTELLLAISILPAITLTSWSDALWPRLESAQLVAWPGAVVKWCVSALVVIPPAGFMGLTLPLLVHALLVERGRLGREGVWLYALNTAGGVLGLALTGGVLLVRYGVHGSMWLAATANLALGLICLVVSTTRPRRSLPSSPVLEVAEDCGPTFSTATPLRDSAELSGRSAVLTWPWAVLIAFASGFVVVGSEVFALHFCHQVFVASLPLTTAVLAVVILCLAVAAALAPAVALRLGGAQSALTVALALTGLWLALAPPSLMVCTGHLQPAAAAGSVWYFLVQVAATLMLSIGPGLLCAGFVFPLALIWLERSRPAAAGGAWAWLLAANGIGGLIGAEAAGAVLMPLFGLHRGIGAIGLLEAGLCAAVWVRWSRASHRRPVKVLCGTAVPLSVLVWGLWLGNLPQLSPTHPYSPIATLTSREGVLSVVTPKSYPPSAGEVPRALVLNNQYILGGTLAAADERRQARLPLLLHAEPREVAFIGLATGITAGAALELPGVEAVTAVEILDSVAEAAGRYFADQNGEICTAAKAHVLIEDGRTWIRTCDDRFDVVVGDLYRPFGAGEGRLFAQEHFAAVQRALRRGGLFCQWLPMYQLEEHQFQVVLDTFASVFQPVHLLRLSDSAKYPIVGLCGRKQDGPGLAGPRPAGTEPAGSPWYGDATLAADLYLGAYLNPQPARGQLNTLNNMWLELDAGRTRIIAGEDGAYLRGARWREFEKKLRARLSTTPAEASIR